MGKVKIIGSLFIVFLIVTTINAATDEPGGIKDPIVTESYVSEKLKELKEELTGEVIVKEVAEENDTEDLDLEVNFVKQEELNEANEKIEELEELVTILSQKVTQMESKSIFRPIEITEGMKLLAGESTQIILRSGKAKIVASESGGIQDATDGLDLKMDEEVPRNHLLTVPRKDGRGIIMETKGWVMIKGDYELEDLNKNEEEDTTEKSE